jgi:hypothetical protein
VTDHIVAGTGSRSLQVADNATKRYALDAVTLRLRERLSVHGDRLVVMSGMAEGFDSALALAGLKLGIRVWAVVPNRGYGPYSWGEHSTTGTPRLPAFQAILDQSWKVTYVMEDVHRTELLYLNGVHANFVRNDFMVEQAHEFLVWDPRSKGTAHCFAAIKRAGKPYEILSPEPATLPI